MYDRRHFSNRFVVLCILIIWSVISALYLWFPGGGEETAVLRGSNPTRQPRITALSSERTIDTSPSLYGKSTSQEHDVQAASHSASSASNSVEENVVSYEKGIVLCLYERIVAMGISLIHELRCSGNKEVIQVYYCYPDEISNRSRGLFSHLKDVQLIDVCTEMVQSKQLTERLAKKFKSYWIKPLALYHTNISEVLLLDADVLTMRNPNIIRTSPDYIRTGTMFFYDRVVRKRVNFNRMVRLSRSDKDPPVQYLKAWIDKFPYKRFHLSGPAPSEHMDNSFAYRELSCHEQDSSMLAVDKRRVGKALDVLWYLITEKRFLYTFSWGDKESFWLSWEFAHQPYTFSPWGVGAVDSYPNDDMKKHPKSLCGSMAHYMPVESEIPELLYVNGKALLDPYPFGIKDALNAGRKTFLYNLNPTYVSQRSRRMALKPFREANSTVKMQECMTDQGSTALPEIFKKRLVSRRMYLIQLWSLDVIPVDTCEGDLSDSRVDGVRHDDDPI